MTDVIKVLVEMPDYCAACGYYCCNGCKISVKECFENKPIVCGGYPFFGVFFGKGLEGYSGPFGVLGIGGWYITSHCKGLDIKLPGQSKTLGEKLEIMRQELNTRPFIKELYDYEKSITLRVLEADPDEIADLVLRSKKFLKEKGVNF